MVEYTETRPLAQAHFNIVETDLSDLLGRTETHRDFLTADINRATADNSGCDLPLAVSMFADVKAQRIEPNHLSLRQLQDRLNSTTARDKAALPLVKLATFGDARTDKGSLRHDANLLRVSGVEGDYDAGAVSPQDAAERLRQAGIAGLIYTTPSHTAEAPRWRVLAPLARPVAPAEREALCARLNGALGGILATESFTPSQSYYFGAVTGRPVESVLVEGQPLDRVSGVASIGPQPKPVKSSTDLSDLFREPADRAEVRRALALITDSDDRDQWLKIGMALHAEFAGSDEGFDLWSHWSRQSLKFDERDQRQKWKSFRRSGVGIGTLFEIAKGYGYERPSYFSESDFDDLPALPEPEKPKPSIRTATVGASGDDPAAIQARQVEALSARMMGSAPTDAARPFMQMGLADYARDALTRSGTVGVAMMGREELLQRAMHTVSDFPELLTGAGNRVLADAYKRAESPLKQLARQRTAADFRPLSTLKVGNFTKLEKVTEAGEIKALSTAEAKEGYSLETFGGIFSLSRKAIINDDLGAFARWGEMMGQAAAETEAGQLLALLTANAGAGVTMGDGKALFHADHGNLAGTGAALSEVTLDAARQAMRTQKMMDGKTPVNVVPRFLVVSPALETAAEKLLTSIQPNTTADVNPFGGKLSLIVEPRLTGNGWFIFGDPATAPVLEYAYLSSAQGPQLSSRDGWEVLGREFRVTLDFGAGATDHRGAYRNAGA